MQVKGNIRKTWKVIGSVLYQNRLSLIPKSFKVDGVDVTSTDIIAQKFNEFFTNNGCKSAATIPDCPVSYKDYLTGQFYKKFPIPKPNQFCRNNRYCQTFLIKKTSSGVDGIPLHILEATINNIAEPLSRITNCS